MVLGMGFNMRTMDVRFWGFSALHLLATLAIPALLYLLTGCSRIEDEVIENGPEVQAAAISSEIMTAMEGKTLADVVVGDKTMMLNTQKVFTNPEESTGLNLKEVLEKSAPDANGIIDIKILNTVYDSNGQVTKQDTEACQVMSDGSAHNCEYSPLFVSSETQRSSTIEIPQQHYVRAWEFFNLSPRNNRTTFHNLSVSRGTEEVPSNVKNEPNCGNVPGCILNVVNIQFDQVSVVDGERTRYRHEMKLTKDVPFLGAVMNHCIKFIYKVENKYVPVTLCDRLVDFRYGQ